jgi:NAD(P)-dependent dehydrogenase (short-subunit alcohol dehydrogenase family)
MSLDPRCLSGRNAVVVGASSGINLGVAHRLGSLGAQIAIVSRSSERIAAAADALRADGLDVTHHAGDVREATAMQSIMTEVADAKGPIDIVLSGAAGNFFVPAAKMSPNAFKTVIDIDLIGTFNVLSAAYPHLKRPGAVLINITAPQAERDADPLPGARMGRGRHQGQRRLARSHRRHRRPGAPRDRR